MCSRNNRASTLSSLVFALIALAQPLAAFAGCPGQWRALAPGTNGDIFAITTTTNGDVVVGGTFTQIGGVAANNIARWDGASWHAMGAGIGTTGHVVYCLQSTASGHVIAGGSFTAPSNCIAEWNGTSWVSMGPGLYAPVLALTKYPNGDILAAGGFLLDSVGASMGRWDGDRWIPVGTRINPSSNAVVHAVSILPNGDIVAGGEFPQAANAIANYIARWDGVLWNAMGEGMNAPVMELITLGDGSVVAGGGFDHAGGIEAIGSARWDGSQWSSLGRFHQRPFAVLLTGELVAAGSAFDRWNGSTWESLDWNHGTPRAITVSSDGTLLVAGFLGFPNDPLNNGLAAWHSIPDFAITEQPQSLQLLPSATATFNTAAAGADVSFRWRKDGLFLADSARISGSGTDHLAIAGTSTSDQGNYDCVVSDQCGLITTSPAAFSCKPIIRSHPSELSMLVSGLQLHVTVPPGASYSYRWRQDAQNLVNTAGIFSGVTTPNLSVLAQDPSLAGHYECLLTDSCGTTLSRTGLVYCPSDFNRDWAIDFFDYLDFIVVFASGSSDADFDGDSVVDFFDYLDFVATFSAGC